MEVESAKAPTARSAFSVGAERLVWPALVASLLALPALTLPAGAAATPLFESEECFTPTKPTAPFTLAEGPDGNVWFTNEGSTKIGRVTQSCEVTEFSPGLSSAAYGIAKGPDGNVWFTEPSAKMVGYIDPSEPATSLEEFSVPSMPASSYITLGPDGNLWFTLGTAGLGRITPSGVVSEFPIAGVNACSIATGPDGTIWFGSCAIPRKVVHITSGGTVEPFEVAGNPTSIAVSPDGRAWIPGSNSPVERIAAVSPSGVVTHYTTLANASYTSLTAGPDGNIWAQNRASANEKQKVTIEATENLGGTFTLIWGGEETAPISVSAPPVIIESELATLPGLPPGVIKIGRTASSNKVELTFEFVGKLARTDVPLMGCNGGGLHGRNDRAGNSHEAVSYYSRGRIHRISAQTEHGSVDCQSKCAHDRCRWRPLVCHRGRPGDACAARHRQVPSRPASQQNARSHSQRAWQGGWAGHRLSTVLQQRI